MEIGSSSLLGSGSRCCSWILIVPLALLCCCCCLPFAAAGLFINSRGSTVLPDLDDIPPVPTMPAIPSIPTRIPFPGSSLPLLDPEAIPISGSASLQSGFSPDPYTVEVNAGGSADTSASSPDCGYTSYHPAFVLDWGAGTAPKTFLRIFFTPDNDTGTTLLVHTPDDKWLCEQDSVLDLPSASSGEYAIWVGTQQDEPPAQGSLSISGSKDVTP